MYKNWRCVNLTQEDAMKFWFFLRKNKIKYEPSGNGKMVHFEVFVGKYEEKICNDFLSNL